MKISISKLYAVTLFGKTLLKRDKLGKVIICITYQSSPKMGSSDVTLSSIAPGCTFLLFPPTRERYGEVNVALAIERKSRERWIIVSDQPCSTETFREYSWRFDIEEGFLDDKSNGFQLESSRIRSAQMLSRLCLVLAITTLYLSSSGTDVAEYGERRWIDPHWFRGSSYLKIAWRWIRQCLVHGFYLPTDLRLSDTPDPQPAIASRRQAQHRHRAFQFHPPSADPFSSSNPQSLTAA